MARWIFSLPASVVILALGGCNIHEALPMPDNIPDQPPMEETNSPAGFDCFEAGSVVEDMACADPQLAAADKILAATLHEKIRHADIFGRDALEANQRAWLLGLNEAPEPMDASDALAIAICHLHTAGTLERQRVGAR